MPNNEPEWLGHFRTALMSLDDAVTQFKNSTPSLEDSCNALALMHGLKADLSAVYDTLAAFVSDELEERAEFSLSDGGLIEKKWAADRKKWQHKDLASVVAKRLIQSSIDMDTGEVLHSQEEVIARLLDFIQPSYWRIKELAKIGINADMYCEVGESKSSIIVRKAK